MRTFRRILGSVVLALILIGAAVEAQPRQPEQQDEFVPLAEAGPQEQLPAAPLVITAYAFVWLACFGYLWTIAQRIRKVEADLRTLERGSR
jgi:CcmD family protein